MEKGRRRLGAGLLLLVVASFALGAALGGSLPTRLTLPGSTVVRYADGSVAHVFLSPDERWRIPVRLDEVDPDYIEALIALEDGRFRAHPGVDIFAIARATVGNLRAGRVQSGASTITMQAIRLSEPRPRTLSSKGIEALRAMQLELHWTKEEVLEAYLDLVPYGRNVEGIEAGTQALFGHSAQDLTVAELCTLLAIPQDPSRRAPSPSHSETLRAARDGVCERLAEAGALPLGEGQLSVEEVLAEVRATPVPTSLRPQPRDVAHAARWMVGTGQQGLRVDTTLDRGVQALVERQLATVRAERARQGIHNVAVVVVEHETGQVRALSGGFDFWDPEHGGQIPAFAQPRSPGSTLKPLIYALAIDEGSVLPETLVADVPVAFGSYSPENYDGGYDGLVPLEQALARSLNVPFVELLAELGVEQFLGRLRATGATSLVDDPGHYGLSAAVGGIELSPLELAGVYLPLARSGTARPLRWRLDQPEKRGLSLVSPGSAWLTRRALRLRDRPDFPARRQLAALPRDIAWKTGTSFGHRDAWAVGMGQRYLVVVWLGNLDQQSSAALVGAQAAGPLLFDIIEGLGDGRTGPPEAEPDELTEVAVCSLSGLPPTGACPESHLVLARRTAVPTRLCPLHRTVEVDLDTGEQVRPGCREGLRTEQRVSVQWPARVQRYLTDHFRHVEVVPPLSASCRAEVGHAPPRIVSPAAGEVLLLVPGLDPSEQEVPLEAEGGSPGGELSWFVDSALIGATKAHERLWWTPSPGSHSLVVQDRAGATHRVDIRVRSRE